MQKWELRFYYAYLPSPFSPPNVYKIWADKDKKTGKTAWDILKDYASEGWELISVTSTTSEGTTTGVLYTFKRPIEEPRE